MLGFGAATFTSALASTICHPSLEASTIDQNKCPEIGRLSIDPKPERQSGPRLRK